MSKLKLFISHSSRLDDIDHPYEDDERNWRLLRNIRSAIKSHYGDRVDVLVDKYSLIPGEDWDHDLNLWMAECHVAIILFSKRAIEKSNWVAKEAAVLSWRKSLDSNFKLIPVLFAGETTAEQLQKDFLGILKIDTRQCIRDASTANDILCGLEQQIGTPNQLAGQYPQTPLEELQAGIAKILSNGPTLSSLDTALSALGIDVAINDSPEPYQRYADLLARHLVCSNEVCFDHFQIGIDRLHPKPLREQAREILRNIRSLWVECAAASTFSSARDLKRPLLLNGQLISYPGPDPDDKYNSKFFTLERYIERSYPGSKLYRIVSLDSTQDPEQMKHEIRTQFLGGGLPPIFSDQELDNRINDDPNTLILLVRSASDPSALPHSRLIPQLEELYTTYDKLIIVIGVIEPIKTAPKPIKVIQPLLMPEREKSAYLGEQSAHQYLLSM